jgi:hypothetical protein
MKKIFYTEDFMDVCPLCGGKLETYPNYMKGHGLFDTTECENCSYIEVSSLEVAKKKVELGEFKELVVL